MGTGGGKEVTGNTLKCHREATAYLYPTGYSISKIRKLIEHSSSGRPSLCFQSLQVTQSVHSNRISNPGGVRCSIKDPLTENPKYGLSIRIPFRCHVVICHQLAGMALLLSVMASLPGRLEVLAHGISINRVHLPFSAFRGYRRLQDDKEKTPDENQP